MSKLVILIGCIALAAIMLSIPILTACAFFYGWCGFIKLVLFLCFGGEFVILYANLKDRTEEEL